MKKILTLIPIIAAFIALATSQPSEQAPQAEWNCVCESIDNDLPDVKSPHYMALASNPRTSSYHILVKKKAETPEMPHIKNFRNILRGYWKIIKIDVSTMFCIRRE